MSFERCKILALLGSLVCGTASATVVYDTLGPANAYRSSSWIIGNGEGGSTPTAYNYTSADLFVPTESGYLSSITAALSLLPFTVTSPIEYDIRANTGDQPGAIIASSTVDLLENDFDPALYTATFSGSTYLDSSTSYWLSLSATYAGTDAAWQLNAIGATTTHAFTGTPFLAPGQWQVANNSISGAARIEVIEAVPEVSQAMLLLLGTPLLVVAARKRSKR